MMIPPFEYNTDNVIELVEVKKSFQKYSTFSLCGLQSGSGKALGAGFENYLSVKSLLEFKKGKIPFHELQMENVGKVMQFINIYFMAGIPNFQVNKCSSSST
jgi:hypothetical protein